MKKLINNPENVVQESLLGLFKSHGDILNVYFNPDYITRKKPSKNKVALISGGGSGHEPLHGGYVGYGMLDAACPGDVFTSPTPDQIIAAVNSVSTNKGTLLIVKNYSGDVMNFQMAADMCTEANIQTIIIDDDVAVEDSLYTSGRRGVGTTVLLEKICGAAAERENNLDKVAEIARFCKENGRSMGMALTSCIAPAVGKPTFELPADEVEMGVGIHGEPGRTRMNMRTANEFADMLTEAVVKDIPFKKGDDLIIMLNGMGGTPLMELYILYSRIVDNAKKMGINIKRNIVGNYITSLEMQGFSLTAMKTTEEVLSLWDAPVHTAAIRWGV